MIAMIAKKDLIVGKQYVGRCRNARVALWDGKVFWYLRTKFGDVFAEKINHPEDDNGYDLFIPETLINTDCKPELYEG